MKFAWNLPNLFSARLYFSKLDNWCNFFRHEFLGLKFNFFNFFSFADREWSRKNKQNERIFNRGWIHECMYAETPTTFGQHHLLWDEQTCYQTTKAVFKWYIFLFYFLFYLRRILDLWVYFDTLSQIVKHPLESFLKILCYSHVVLSFLETIVKRMHTSLGLWP